MSQIVTGLNGSETILNSHGAGLECPFNISNCEWNKVNFTPRQTDSTFTWYSRSDLHFQYQTVDTEFCT